MNQKASNPTHPDSTLPVRRSGLAALGLAALGIVFGDIGTSPLYTLKTVLSMTVGTPTPAIVLGVLSLIVVDVNHHHIGEIRHLCHEYRQ